MGRSRKQGAGFPSAAQALCARDALDAVAKLANWKPRVAAQKLSSGNVVSGRGVAVGGLNGTWAAVVADIQVDKQTGKIAVKDLYGAEQAGFAVAPEQLINQMIGCLITGASRALYEQVVSNTKRVTSLDWVSYPTIRFKDAPRTHVVSVERYDLQPHGSGEPTLVPVPAAIANAFFDATGVRIRESPDHAGPRPCGPEGRRIALEARQWRRACAVSGVGSPAAVGHAALADVAQAPSGRWPGRWRVLPARLHVEDVYATRTSVGAVAVLPHRSGEVRDFVASMRRRYPAPRAGPGGRLPVGSASAYLA
jgi:hypothetical protein